MGISWIHIYIYIIICNYVYIYIYHTNMMSMQWEYNHQYGIHSLLATIPFMGIHHGTYEGEGISLQEMCSG